MTNNIPRIGIGTNGVNPYVNPKAEGEKKAEEKTEGKNPQTTNANVNPDDVLAYMAQNAAVNAANVKPTKGYDVSKYVTPEQAARIAGFVTSFEDEVAKGLVALNDELGGINLPESAKLELAARIADRN